VWVRPGVDVVFHARATEVVRDATSHADSGAGAVPDLEDEWAARTAVSLLAVDHGHQLGGVLGVHRDPHLALRLVQFSAKSQRLVRLGVVAPFKSSCCSYAPRAEEQEGDHGSDVWRQVLAQPLDRFAAEEALSDAALILGWLLDERARPRREPLRTVTEWLTPARGRAASRSIGEHGAALASP